MNKSNNDWNPPAQLSLWGGSRNRVSRTAQQESERAQKMTATSGRTALRRFESFNQTSAFSRTFLASLVGLEGWYSTRCRLTWKLKGTKYNRLYFQLAPSTRRTGGIGSGLLHTPRATIIEEPNERFIKRMGDRSENCYPHLSAQVKDMVYKGLLPTPAAMDSSSPDYFNQTGKSSQLNPLFVLEMMGFPPDYLELPFLNGETNQSKQQETQ